MQVTSNKKIIVVLGMHRSGTSAISRGLQVMGVELGDRLMPPNREVNAKGFWEDVDINALNIEMLQALGSDWHYLVPVAPADVDALCQKGYFLRAVELLRHKVGNAAVFGFKDPRVAKLLPFWKRVFNHCQLDASYVLAVRHPLSVARSLEKRDGMEAVKSYMLWLEHVIVSLTGTVGSKRVVVDYDLLMQSAEHELERIAKKLDLTIDHAALQGYREEFLDESLRHSVYDLNDLLLDEACPSLVREVYATMFGVASGAAEDDKSLRGKAELWAREFHSSIPLLGLVEALNLELNKSGHRVETLGQELNKCRHQLAVLEGVLSERGIQLELDYRYIVERDKQIASLDAQITALKGLVAERDEQLAGLTDEIVRRGEWALGLERQLKEAQAWIIRISSSNSWRITLPLREIRRWINAPLSQATSYLSAALKLGKALYGRLPLSPQTKTALRLFVAKRAPWVLRASSGLPIPAPVSPVVLTLVPPVSDAAATAAAIRLATSERPLVSIVIPIYGQCDYSLRCLCSIAANQPSTPYEVIVIDDCSPDDSFEILHKVRGIQLIHNPENQGFIRSCNIGAKAAKGRYVHFLNNDTQVVAGWLDELVRTFDEFPGAGLAGSKLVYPDGTLQEAGGIIWRDGSAWNFGRNQDPSLPVYNYARETDYCSGASIMLPKELFDSLGGFDEHYLPAYCEDADLALKIRDLGYRVIYQPLSVVVHFEGVTSGTDTTKGVKAYQVENSKKLFNRWRERLQQHQAPGEDVDDAKDRCATRRVLVIDHCTPTPDQDAGSVTVFNLLLLLREMGFQVTFIPEDNYLYMPKYSAALQRQGIEVLYAPYTTSVESHLKEHGRRYDLAFLFRPGVVERHLKTIRRYCPKAKVAFHTVDLHYLRMSREADLLDDTEKQKAATQMKVRELAAIRAVDVSIVHSTTELELLRQELSEERIHVYPLILDVVGSDKAFRERRDIVFVGGYQHVPNVDAVLYFVGEIMPILRRRLPGVRFHAVGSKPPAEILALAAEDVVIAGFVEDLNSFLGKMRISVAPLRYGAGIKGKIGTAMAVGLPIVATSVAAEGMSLTDGENILVADGAEDFARAVIRLYEDESLWCSISESSIKFADSAWGAEAAWNILATILADVGIGTNLNKRPLRLYSASGK